MVTQESINYIAEGLAGRRKVEFLQIVQQRAELLEALKLLIEDADSTCETYDIAKAAITKAEAAE